MSVFGKEHFGDFRIIQEASAIHTMLLLKIAMNQYVDGVVEEEWTRSHIDQKSHAGSAPNSSENGQDSYHLWASVCKMMDHFWILCGSNSDFLIEKHLPGALLPARQYHQNFSLR